MKIALIESFYTGSHKSWADDVVDLIPEITLFQLSGRNWKWRMHGGAVSLAEQVIQSQEKFDHYIVTDMLDLSLFAAQLYRANKSGRFTLYMHENQLSYPWSPTDPDTGLERDLHYAWINFTSCLQADSVLFNSAYHKTSFLDALDKYIHRFPDFDAKKPLEAINRKSSVLPLGFHFPEIQKKVKKPIILWNHRWEFDKQPELFFQSLFDLQAENIDFQLIVLGESYQRSPLIFEKAKEVLSRQIIHWGYVSDRKAYEQLLDKSTILPVTSKQDFFGISAVEAIGRGVFPILPKRLAFPEHIDEAKFPDCFYDEDDDFYQKLKKVIIEESYQQNVSTEVEKYNWKNLLPAYQNALFEQN